MLLVTKMSNLQSGQFFQLQTKESVEFHYSMTACEAHWKNGDLNGLAAVWYKNGKLASTSAWKPDRKHCPIIKIIDRPGIVVSWHENGQ